MTASQAAAAPEAPPLTSDESLATNESLATTSWLQRRLHATIIFYQRAREGRPSPCRFFPSCSAYALESIEVHGTWRGSWLSARRLVRCRPLGPSGFDPVPEARTLIPTSSHDVSCSSHSPAPKGG